MTVALLTPILTAPAPAFVGGYAALTLAALVVGSLVIWLSDTSRDDELSVESLRELDPCRVAYLRGGASQVARLLQYDMVARGLIVVRQARRSWFRSETVLARGQVEPPQGSSLQRSVWDWLTQPRRLSDARSGAELVARVTPLCETLDRQLRLDRLLETGWQRFVRRAVGIGLTLLIVIPGVARLGYDVVTAGHLAAGPIPVLLAGLIAVRIACRPRWQSDLGHRYLEDLEAALAETAQRTNGVSASSDRQDVPRLLQFAVQTSPTLHQEAA